MKQEIKEEAGAGVAVAVFIIVLVILGFLLWPPGAYVYGKWSDYWDTLSQSSSLEMPSPEQTVAERNREIANSTCAERAQEYLAGNYYLSAASSTSTDWSTYDCYGLNKEKIPLK